MPGRLEARTWMLVAVAAWAVLCAAVALSGFGGQYKLLPDDPSLAPRLPAVPSAASRSAMGPLEAYAEASSHPLFYPDRKPVTVHLPGQDATAAQPLNVALTSVIMTPTLQMAIVQDPQSKQSLRVREGQPIGGIYNGWKLTGLSPRTATFDGGSQGETTLNLRVFDGKGGEEPTRTGLTPQAVASGMLGPSRGGAAEPPPPPNPADQPDPQAPPDASAAAAAQAANRATMEAQQQAEQIRERIEQRRQQAQAQRAASNNKD